MSKSLFFNPRLYSERRRVTSNIKSGEIIIIPFAGVGPFVLPAAGKGAKVYALEINPDACAWLRENIRINRFEGQVIVIQDDFENLFRTGEIFQILDSKTHKESQNGESGGNCKKVIPGEKIENGEKAGNKDFSGLPACSGPGKGTNKELQVQGSGFDRA